MPTLQIRNVEESTYHLLEEAARREHRSLASQALHILEQGLEQDRVRARRIRRAQMVAELLEHPVARLPEGAPAPEDLIREDRDR